MPWPALPAWAPHGTPIGSAGTKNEGRGKCYLNDTAKLAKCDFSTTMRDPATNKIAGRARPKLIAPMCSEAARTVTRSFTELSLRLPLFMAVPHMPEFRAGTPFDT